MNITRDIITDLLPAYHSGEASADTERLVEGYLAKDPEFARWARAEPRTLLDGDAMTDPAEEVEMKAFRRTRSLLRRRGWFLGLGIYTTLAPLTFTFSSESGVDWLFAGRPLAVAAFATLAALSWAAYFRTRSALKAVS